MRQYGIEHKHQGYILLIVLLFLQFAVLMGLYSLEAVWIENKMSHDDLLNTQLFAQMDHLMTSIGLQIKDFNPNCVVHYISSDELKSQPISWWQNESCAGIFQSIQYYYVVESLGEDPCAHIKQLKDNSAEYYRISLLGIDKDKGGKLLLQSTFIKPAQQSHACDGTTHPVQAGQQSLRALN